MLDGPLSGRGVHVLSEAELDQVHATTLRILKQVGVRFDDAEAVSIFRGCTDAQVEGAVVRLNEELVERAIQAAPSQIALHARNPKYTLRLGAGHTYYTSGFGATFVCDSENKTYREATLADVRAYLTVADAMPNVHYVLMPFIPQDLPPEFAELYAIALQFNDTEKHIGLSTPHSKYLDEIIAIGSRIAEDCGVEGQLFSFGCTVNSPLTYSREILPKLIKSARAGVPVRIVSGALAGGTAPVTLAGALAMQNAEVLAGVTLCQLIRPGTPVVYGSFAGAMDMRTGKWAAAGPELALINGATGQLCRRYGIPLGYGTGGVGESRIPDLQAGFEKALTLLFTALAGVEVIHNGVSGLLASGMAISLEQLIADNEMATITNRLLRGMRVDEETLAFGVVQSIGPGGGFLEHDHTRAWFRKEQYFPSVVRRDVKLEYPSDSETLLACAREKVKGIVASHHPTPLPHETQEYVQSIIEKITGSPRKVFD